MVPKLWTLLQHMKKNWEKIKKSLYPKHNP